MQIELNEVTVADLSKDYKDDAENGVTAYGGKLDIRPPYQREFIYKDKQREAVIDTVLKGFPLNVMYWATHTDGTYEVMDGQQRTISICQYVAGVYSVPINAQQMYFGNLQTDIQQRILGYKLMVYFCTGEPSEKLDWFKTINIAGERLTDQELRNAVYHGPWVSDAKRYFSKTGCAAYGIGGNYLTGSPIRQEFLETVIRWISDGHIDQYMAEHQHKDSAEDLWNYFNSVISWVQTVYSHYYKEMKGVDWGTLFNKYGTEEHDPAEMNSQVARLMEDEDVSNRKGIFAYLLSHEEKELNIRAFSEKQKGLAYQRQQGICPICHKHFEINEMEGDHITPWCEGGKTSDDNLQMLCKDCNRRKSDK